jgi:PEP-CTERM motif
MKEHKQFVGKPMLAAAAAALVLSTVGAFAGYDVTITPDQFNFLTWGGNLSFSTVGAYAGDNATGYGYTMNYGASPSATIEIPLPAGLAPGWNLYTIYQWNPIATSQYHVINISADGGSVAPGPVPGMPWGGQFSSQNQYLQVNGSPAGAMVELGPGPQSPGDANDPAGPGSYPYPGFNVWINGSASQNPYLQIHYLGFETAEETFDAIRVVQVPEPTTLALSLLGGFGLLGAIARRNRK